MAAKQAHQQQQQSQHQLATSLITASAKIQQRQQKFLAAAAKSATSPPARTHLDQNPSVIKQQAAKANDCDQCCRIDTVGAAIGVDVPTKSMQAPEANATLEQPAVFSNCNTCCHQIGATTRCCQINDESSPSKWLPAVALDDKSCPIVVTTQSKSAVKKAYSINHNDHRQPSQQTGCKRQTVAPTTPSKCDSLGGVARSKVLSMATMMNNASGNVATKSAGISSSSSVKISGGNKLKQQVAGGVLYRSSLMNCASITSIAANDDSTASDSRRTNTTTTSNAASNVAAASDAGDINQSLPRTSNCDANNLAVEQQSLTSQSQREVRQSGENKDNDDNINVKNTTKHNNHYHHNHYYNHYHYYNHNYLNFHRLQQHPNYFHLQYQPTQQQVINSPNQTNTQPQQQPVMAHYKFHNDCQSSVLTYEQVKRLDLVMDQTVPIHGRGNSPTLYVKLKELIRLVKYKLQHEHSIEIRDVRLNGGAASYVLAPENSKYNDLDLVFGTDLSNEDRFDVIRDVVLECLMEFYPNILLG